MLRVLLYLLLLTIAYRVSILIFHFYFPVVWKKEVGGKEVDKFGNVSRLTCLQSPLGRKRGDGTWHREDIFGHNWDEETKIKSNHSPEANHWVYKPACLEGKLDPFNLKVFCKKSLECQSILVVGDSTINQFFESIIGITGNYHNKNVSNQICPNSEFCYNHPACRFPVVKEVPNIEYAFMCQDVCTNNNNNNVRLKFVRHDHLVNHHGKDWQRDLQCEHWKSIMINYKYIFVSTGPRKWHKRLHLFLSFINSFSFTFFFFFFSHTRRARHD